MTREQAQALVERVVKMSKADAIQVNVGGGYSANMRFADNRISTAGGVVDGERERAELVRAEARRRRRRTTSPTRDSSAPCGSRKRWRSSRPTIPKRCRRSGRSSTTT